MNKQKYLAKAIAWAKSKAPSSLKAITDEYEDPKSFVNQTTEEVLQPDITFKTESGQQHFTEIVLKSDATQKQVTKWKLLSTLAKMKYGKLHLLAPKGHKMHAQRLVSRYNIPAVVHSI